MREIVDLDVRELHLVDSPANKRKFLLMKSGGGADDGEKKKDGEKEKEKDSPTPLTANDLTKTLEAFEGRIDAKLQKLADAFETAKEDFPKDLQDALEAVNAALEKSDSGKAAFGVVRKYLLDYSKASKKQTKPEDGDDGKPKKSEGEAKKTDDGNSDPEVAEGLEKALLKAEKSLDTKKFEAMKKELGEE